MKKQLFNWSVIFRNRNFNVKLNCSNPKWVKFKPIFQLYGNGEVRFTKEISYCKEIEVYIPKGTPLVLRMQTHLPLGLQPKILFKGKKFLYMKRKETSSNTYRYFKNNTVWIIQKRIFGVMITKLIEFFNTVSLWSART